MAKTLITLNVISESDDSEDVINQLKDWFNSNSIGLEFHNIHSIDIEFLKDYKSFDQLD